MTTTDERAMTAETVGGALTAGAGLLMLLNLLLPDGSSVPAMIALVALAVGSVMLAIGPGGVVSDSRVGRIALVVFGVGPLAFLLPFEGTPVPAQLIGTGLILLTTIATIVAAVVVVRAGIVRGSARWVLVLVAVHAVVAAALSTVPLGDLAPFVLAWPLQLSSAVLLLVWGGALVADARRSAIRQRGGAFVAEWRRSTRVDGSAADSSVGS